MTTIYHTPITVGAAANADTWNAVFGQLDQAISSMVGDTSYNVIKFGATGDGSTPDHIAIQAAIDAAAAAHAPVFFPGGTYVIGSGVTLNLASGSILMGQGSSSILQRANGTCASMIYAANVADIQIRDLALDGNLDNQTGVGFGIALESCSDVLIRNCTIHHTTEAGIRGVITGNNITIDSCRVTDCASKSIWLDGDLLGVNITNNYIADSASTGIQVYNSSGEATAKVRITNNMVDTCGEIGIYILNVSDSPLMSGNFATACTDGLEMATCVGGVISGNSTSYNTADGIVMDQCNMGTISGNGSEMNAAMGINISSSSKISVTGNTVCNNNQLQVNAVRCSGITLYEHSYLCNVTGNICMDGGSPATQRYGIAEFSDDPPTNVPDYNLIADNMVTGNVDGGIYRWTGAGTTGSTVIRGNWGWKTEAEGLDNNGCETHTITHGLVGTPTGAIVMATVAGHFASVTALDATHITIALRNHDNTQIWSGEPVYWRAWM